MGSTVAHVADLLPVLSQHLADHVEGSLGNIAVKDEQGTVQPLVGLNNWLVAGCGSFSFFSLLFFSFSNCLGVREGTLEEVDEGDNQDGSWDND